MNYEELAEQYIEQTVYRDDIYGKTAIKNFAWWLEEGRFLEEEELDLDKK